MNWLFGFPESEKFEFPLRVSCFQVLTLSIKAAGYCVCRTFDYTVSAGLAKHFVEGLQDKVYLVLPGTVTLNGPKL